MGTISNLEVKQWENILEKDQKPHFIKNWEHQAKRFGKKELLELFEDGYEYHQTMDKSEERFRISFQSRVSSVLAKKKNVEWFKKKTYNTLMSLYGKFVHLRKTYGDILFKEMTQISDKVEIETKEIKAHEKKELVNTISNQSGLEEIKIKIAEIREKIEELHYEIQSYHDAEKGLEQPSDTFKDKINQCEIKIKMWEERLKNLEKLYSMQIEKELETNKNNNTEEKTDNSIEPEEDEEKKPEPQEKKPEEDEEKKPEPQEKKPEAEAQDREKKRKEMEKRQKEFDDLYSDDPDEPRWQK